MVHSRSRPSAPRRSAVATALLLATGVGALPGLSQDVPPEDPGPLPAARYLEADELGGPLWTVAPEATTDGFTLTFQVDSRFGSWPAHSRLGVRQRIREIAALEELEAISQTDVFLDAVQNAVVEQLELVATFAEQPVATMRAVPPSVTRWFRTSSYRVKEGYVDARQAVREARQDLRERRREKAADREEEASGEPAQPDDATEEGASDGASESSVQRRLRREALSYLRISGAERDWYARLRVDPYTDNEVLRDAVSKVARVEGLTNFGLEFVGIPEIPGAGELGDVMELVWETDPWELRRLNREKLLAAGLSLETARAYEDNRDVPLSVQTGLIEALERLEGVGGRETVIARAIEIEERGEGSYLLGALALLVHLHETTSELQEILPDTRLPVARARSGALVTAIPREALFWTEAVAEAGATFAAAYRDEPAEERVFWVAGTTSPRFREGAQALGWTVREGLEIPETAGGGAR